MFFKQNKQEKSIEMPSQGTFVIIGLGRFGSAVAQTLVANGQEVIIVDKDPDRVRELRYLTDYAYVINHLDQKSLEEIGVADCSAAIIAIGSQMDANILATLYCLNLKVPTVIAKANSKDQGSILEKIGAKAVYPEWEMGSGWPTSCPTSASSITSLYREISISPRSKCRTISSASR
ncbi:TrkA family potassium uptake protein [Allobaculum sp. Allo2]|uniref:potassium channel family protein n=1 Tax=Allobaculum sp. Allo2 TaxID=2853432 RepID=UPI001F622757|nr:TrkA family potassium uptake protein [Allobaculum sp. Allo2]UNT92989.1 TrkA family potassium uptake protein [Allobaculum sp. Allo2]